jgi:hypothetical protein
MGCERCQCGETSSRRNLSSYDFNRLTSRRQSQQLLAGKELNRGQQITLRARGNVTANSRLVAWPNILRQQARD